METNGISQVNNAVSGPGMWALVLSGPRTFLGQVQADYGRYLFSSNSEEVKKAVKQDALSSDRICLSPCFDFFSPMRVLPQGIERNPIVLPFEFTLEPTPVYVRYTTIVFIDDMQESDKRVYMHLIEEVTEGTRRQLVERRARQSGIVIGKSMPKNG